MNDESPAKNYGSWEPYSIFHNTDTNRFWVRGKEDHLAMAFGIKEDAEFFKRILIENYERRKRMDLEASED